MHCRHLGAAPHPAAPAAPVGSRQGSTRLLSRLGCSRESAGGQPWASSGGPSSSPTQCWPTLTAAMHGQVKPRGGAAKNAWVFSAPPLQCRSVPSPFAKCVFTCALQVHRHPGATTSQQHGSPTARTPTRCCCPAPTQAAQLGAERLARTTGACTAGAAAAAAGGEGGLEWHGKESWTVQLGCCRRGAL